MGFAAFWAIWLFLGLHCLVICRLNLTVGEAEKLEKSESCQFLGKKENWRILKMYKQMLLHCLANRKSRNTLTVKAAFKNHLYWHAMLWTWLAPKRLSLYKLLLPIHTVSAGHYSLSLTAKTPHAYELVHTADGFLDVTVTMWAYVNTKLAILRVIILWKQDHIKSALNDWLTKLSMCTQCSPPLNMILH